MFLLVIGGTGLASAKDTMDAVMISPCGSSTGICGHPGGTDDEDEGGSESGTGCESSSWGDSSAGGSITVCVDSDGSSTWEESEWGEGYHVVDKGWVIHNADGSVTSITSFEDYSSSY